jgi:hypothetical protein
MSPWSRIALKSNFNFVEHKKVKDLFKIKLAKCSFEQVLLLSPVAGTGGKSLNSIYYSGVKMATAGASNFRCPGSKQKF